MDKNVSYDKTTEKKKQPSENDQNEQEASGLEIPRLIMEREAEKKQEYLQRAKVDVKDILNDKQLKSIRVAELYQSDDMMQA